MKRVFAHIGFSVAITLILLNFTGIRAALAITVIAGALFALFLCIRKTRKNVAAPLCMLSVFLACIIFISTYYGNFLPQSRLNGKTAETSFYVVSLDEKATNGYSYTVKTNYINLNGAPQNIKLTVRTDEKINAQPYQIISADLKFNLVADNGFNSYGSFGENIFLSSKLYKYEVSDQKINSPYKFILKIKSDIRDLVRENINKKMQGVILAIVTGDKSDIVSEVKNNFKESGVSHVMAVSGLHLTAFSGTVYQILKKLRISKKPRTALSLLSVIFYMALTGFTKSVMRTGIMMIVLLAGKLFDEKSDSLNSLGFAVFLICFNPFAVTDAGALLTVSAVLGILTINPILNGLYKPKIKIIKYPYDIFTTSVSVFITTFPVMYFVFGYVSLIGTVLNIIMIPAAQFTLISAYLMIIFQWAAPLLSFFAALSNAGASFMIMLAEKCAGLPFAVKDISSPVTGLVIAAVFALFGIAFIIKGKPLLKRCAVISVVVSAAVLAVSLILNYNSIFIRTISGYDSTAEVVYGKDCAVVVGIDDYSQYYTAKYILISGNFDSVIVADSGIYSEKLAKDIDSNSAEILKSGDFDIDLSHKLNVRYYNDESGDKAIFTVFDKKFEFVSGKCENDFSDSLINGNRSSEYDSEYTINKYGFSERRINQWLK